MIKLVVFLFVCPTFTLISFIVEGFAFGGTRVARRTLTRSPTDVKSLERDTLQGDVDDDIDQANTIIGRRSAIKNSALMSAVIASSDPFPAVAYPGEVITNTEVDLDSLTDLPPIPNGCIRIYLCRHGQTENNRLRIVQGARVDPPVNINGNAQATNLGFALARANPKPELFFSSPLKRAKMTAEIAANVSKDDSEKLITAKQLHSLAEIDFGPVSDGQPISEAKKKMASTYTKWSFGDVDNRPEGGGETGREVLLRACEALETLVNEAKSSNVPCVAAVSHSGYIRLLVGMALNEPLILSTNRKIRNGSVTVIDVQKDLRSRLIGSKPKLLGGWLSQKPKDFNLSVPICKMERINETRHLPLDKI